MRAQVDRLDDRTVRWVAEADHGPFRSLLVLTARTADFLLPWALVSLWIGVRGGRREHVGLARGWGGMALAALVEDVVVKPATQRGRPDPGRFPRWQRRHADPSTSAFPSGHVGAASAFAVATGRDFPAARRLLGPLALFVAYARVFTGRHYASDAVVGLAVGAAAGAVARSVAPPGRR